MTKTGGVTGRYLGFCELGKRFAHKVTRSLKARRSFPENSVFFGYDTCSLEVMEYLKERGVACVLDQIDPCRVEAEMVREEQQKWQGWEDRPLDIPEEFYERHAREWALADRVVVNSEFSRQALIQQGVHGSKIVVVPLSYELHDEMTEGEKAAFSQRKELKRFTQEKPLRVLFLGQVMLRKGIQYLAQAAELLQNLPVKFDIVGPIHISAKAVKTAPQNMFFHGRATRDTINQWYRSADVFVLPTLSDGFALTQIEAMANGLPVIATPNCGAVVSDGVDGFLVPTRDPESLAQVIRRYLEEPEILQKHCGAALQKSKQFSLHRVGTALLDLGREMH
ncbi:MAG: glycosyltransferase family 4 protein [Verrucomicrobia bacterium]|nr:glycosyltransferase family 4 protein [Verrucomicrobiota bacterium]